MEFTFTETVKLATKGFKPSDVAELSKLDESKFSKDDILSLIGNGYSKSEVIKLVDMFESKDVETSTDEDNEDQDDVPNNADTKKADPVKETVSVSDNEDNIDYKKKYEEEKKLREELQHKKAIAPSQVKQGDNKSDYDIALEIAEMY